MKGREEEGCPSVLLGQIQIRAGRRELQVPTFLALVADRKGQLDLQERLVSVVLHGKYGRRPSVVVLVVHIRPLVQQAVDGVQVALGGCLQQWVQRGSAELLCSVAHFHGYLRGQILLRSARSFLQSLN